MPWLGVMPSPDVIQGGNEKRRLFSSLVLIG
jgi:hypothetical protein